MKVAILGPAPPHRGGIAAHTAGLQEALRDAGARVDVIGYRRLYPQVFFPGRSELAPTRSKASNALTISIETIGVKGQAVALDPLRPSAWRAVNAHLRSTRPDLIIVQWWHPAFAPAILAALAGRDVSRVVFVCHNAVSHEAFPGAAPLTALALGRAGAVLCHSDFVAERLSSKHPRLVIERVAMPVLLVAPSEAPARDTIRESYGVGRDGGLVVCPGLVRRYKGVDVLLDAWAGARISDHARLLVAGESYLGRGRLQALVDGCARRDSVCIDDRYLADDELVSLLAAADLVVLPYRSASQSGLVPMAAAVGARLLTSDAGGLSERLSFEADVRGFKVGCRASLRRELERVLSPTALRTLCPDAKRQPIPDPEFSRYSLLRSESWARVIEALDGLVRRLDTGRGEGSSAPRVLAALSDPRGFGRFAYAGPRGRRLGLHPGSGPVV